MQLWIDGEKVLTETVTKENFHMYQVKFTRYAERQGGAWEIIVPGVKSKANSLIGSVEPIATKVRIPSNYSNKNHIEEALNKAI